LDLNFRVCERAKCLDAPPQIRFHPVTLAKKFMLTFLGKILFPRSQRWKQRQNVRLLLAALAVAVLFGVVIAAVMWLVNHPK
jgi:hypothetical protein